MKRSPQRMVMLLTVMAGMALFPVGCGHDEQVSMPVGGTVTINPSAVSFDVLAGACGSTTAPVKEKKLFTITAQDSQGNMLNNAAMTIELDWAANSATQNIQVMALYDADVNPPIQVTSPFNTRTSDHGTKQVYVELDLGGCTYKGNLSVTSGSVYGFVEIEVKTQ